MSRGLTLTEWDIDEKIENEGHTVYRIKHKQRGYRRYVLKTKQGQYIFLEPTIMLDIADLFDDVADAIEEGTF